MSCKNVPFASHDSTVEMTAILDFRTITSSQFYADLSAVGILKNKVLFQFEDTLHVKICCLDKKYRTQKNCNSFIILYHMKCGLLL